MMYDVVIIGAGVTGAFVARELSRYEVKALVLERCSDVAMGTTKANSAIVHAGYDAKPGTLKAKLNAEGNRLMERVCGELDVPYRKIGSFVVAFDQEEEKVLGALYERGLTNGVNGLSILSGDEARSLEPGLSKEISKVLYAREAGIVCPYELTLGAMENALENGVELRLEQEVQRIEWNGEAFSIKTQNNSFESRYIINAAGLYADTIAHLAGDASFIITPRKGEYLLFDKSQGTLVNKVVFQAPSSKGKGILVTPTVDGNLLAGPTAEDIEDKEDLATSEAGLRVVLQKAMKSVPSIPSNQVITSFAGLRARPSDDDFIVAPSQVNARFIHAAGIESPGLSSAPAIGEYVIGLLEQNGLTIKPKNHFNPVRKGIPRFHSLSPEEKNELIRREPRFGRIVCRCEKITEGEVVASIHRPCGATTLDGVKRRTRSGMGRCQGGFCSPRILEILSRELEIPIDQITKAGGESRILISRTKQQGRDQL
ncbi:MAG: NAD(P)/FAD-dependent oxidoreductase [Clostridia bacterium]|nr:NAD(P)/FAD-dependent oxidoreductase [Clostridia bacterium]